MSEKDSTVTTLDDTSKESANKPAKGATRQASVEDTAIDIEAPSNLSGKKKTLTVHPSEGDGGRDAVNVSLNGYMYQIPRGKPVRVPVEVLEVLENAVVTKYKQEGKEQIEYDVPRFAYSAA